MSKLPDYLKSYFWEIDFDRLKLPERRTYIIERILEYGDDRAIHWLKETFPPEIIAAVVRASRNLSPNTANLWAILLKIPKEEIRCFSTPSLPKPGSS